jgi:hypothetical protein
MLKLLQKLIQFFSKGGRVSKTGRIVAKNPKFTQQLKTIANWERTDREMWEWWNKRIKEEKIRDLKLIKQGKLTPEDLQRKWKAELNTLPKARQMRVVQGVPFFEEEVNELNKITDELVKHLDSGKLKKSIVITSKKFNVKSNRVASSTWKSKTGQTHTKTIGSKNPWASSYSTDARPVTITLLPYSEAVKIWPGVSKTTNGWAKGDNIYLVSDNLNISAMGHNYSLMKSNLKRVLTHEVAHVKDPALVRASKLDLRYNPGAKYISDPKIALAKNAPENWLKNYYYTPREVIANLAPVLTAITDNTSRIVKKIGKKRTTAALTELQDWLATGTGPIGNLSSDSKQILGYTTWYQKLFKPRPEAPHVLFAQPAQDQITGFFNTFKTQNPTEYKRMINKMARQVENLKTQVHWTRDLTPESVIKYKVIIK